MTDETIRATAVMAPFAPKSAAVRTDCDDAESAENRPLPPGMTAPEGKSPAEWAYQRIVLFIKRFEERLEGHEEVGLGLAGSEAGTIHIRGMGFFAPDLVTFYGTDQTGTSTQLIQHVTQLNVMLKAVPRPSEEPERIGFALAAKLGADETEGGSGGQE